VCDNTLTRKLSAKIEQNSLKGSDNLGRLDVGGTVILEKTWNKMHMDWLRIAHKRVKISVRNL